MERRDKGTGRQGDNRSRNRLCPPVPLSPCLLSPLPMPPVAEPPLGHLVLLVVAELPGVEEDAVADRARLVPDVRLLVVDHADHLRAADRAVDADGGGAVLGMG